MASSLSLEDRLKWMRSGLNFASPKTRPQMEARIAELEKQIPPSRGTEVVQQVNTVTKPASPPPEKQTAPEPLIQRPIPQKKPNNFYQKGAAPKQKPKAQNITQAEIEEFLKRTGKTVKDITCETGYANGADITNSTFVKDFVPVTVKDLISI